MSAKPGNLAADRLLAFIERVERLQEEIATLRSDIVGIKQEVRSAGFDIKTFNQMLRERLMSADELEQQIALAEIYRKALGLLSDTPLGAAAMKRLSPEPPPPPPPEAGAPPAEAAPAGPTPEDIEAARQAGTLAHGLGHKVTTNPHPFGDPRRAAWDAGWCTSAGSDGMDIPDAWKRTKKDPKK